MSEPHEPSEALLAGRRALEGIKGVTLLEDFQWIEKCKRWCLRCRLRIDGNGTAFAPKETDWHVLIEPSYPWGYLRLHPSKERGLTHTFPHQWHNAEGKENVPWREGFLCLDTAVYAIGRHGFDDQPYEPETRLLWHMQRALEWLEAASTDQLLPPGEPFELPQFHSGASVVIGFNENAASFEQWRSIQNQCGIATLRRWQKNVFIARSFQSIDGTELLSMQWGEEFSKTEDEKTALWIRTKSVPVLPPWQAPTTWGELQEACRTQGIDMYQLLEAAAPHIRDGKEHFALIGFPIPVTMGEKPCRMFWQGLLLPVLTTSKTANGFRQIETSYRIRDRAQTWRESERIQWCDAHNWNMEEISTRGRLQDALTTKQVLLIGAGALGSTLADMLVRGGVTRMTVVDPDHLEMGNLVRHTLHTSDLRQRKASALAEALNHTSPHASVTPLVMEFPPGTDDAIAAVQQTDIVIDTTGNDGVLHHLEAFPWGSPKLFVSIALGLKGQRLYCYAAHDDTFPVDDFRTRINPLLGADIEKMKQAGESLPREGIGCWHPVFPVRVDDVRLLAAAAIKFLEPLASVSPEQPLLSVFEQTVKDGQFTGIQRIAA